jgi:hypothetical protein
MKKILFLLLIVLARTVQANTIVFDTFDPGNTYYAFQGFDVGFGGPTQSAVETAAHFASGASGVLATVDLGLTVFDFENHFGSGQVNVFLYADLADSPDNSSQTFLGSVTPTATFGSTDNSIVSLTPAGTVNVTLGTIYWLVLKPADPSETVVWNREHLNTGTPEPGGGTDQTFDDSHWFRDDDALPAFRITAFSSVPDRGTTFSLLLGALAILTVLKATVDVEKTASR